MLLKNIKDSLSLIRIKLLLVKGIEKGTIVPFDEEAYEPLKHHYFNGMPVYFHIKYTRPSVRGMCYDRASYMFPCYDDALFVTGEHKDLEILYGKGHAGHAWIEKDGYVYDPSDLKVYKKDLYYKIYKIKKVKKSNWAKYMLSSEANKKLYFDIKNSKKEDYMKDGPLRYSLLSVIPVVQAVAESEGNIELIEELNQYLESINYNYYAINNSLFDALKDINIDKIMH